MPRPTSTTDFRKPALLALCIAAILSGPAFAGDTTTTDAITGAANG